MREQMRSCPATKRECAGRGSGVEAELRYAYLWRFRDGNVIYCKGFRGPAEALEAVGLTEQNADANS